ncbi:MAG TPA: DUF1905 domain-containing protein [Polyangiales bacterium]|nr:DUF1905 domain-containing protein [Polyangiales bacterium]
MRTKALSHTQATFNAGLEPRLFSWKSSRYAEVSRQADACPPRGQAKLGHGARVRGEVNGVEYRSSLMKYSRIFHLGIHKAVLKEPGVELGQTITVDIERDHEPLPTDVVPDDLAAVLEDDKDGAAALKRYGPALKREQVKKLLSAKSPNHERAAWNRCARRSVNESASGAAAYGGDWDWLAGFG